MGSETHSPLRHTKSDGRGEEPTQEDDAGVGEGAGEGVGVGVGVGVGEGVGVGVGEGESGEGLGGPGGLVQAAQSVHYECKASTKSSI